MITQELTYPDLNITAAEIYEQMGYGDALPDADVQAETERMISRVKEILRPQFSFFITKATLD
ncbi:MAG: methionine synthase, partial [Prevotella sp.]|nr:methionine synthase [Prevotella sp.]